MKPLFNGLTRSADSYFCFSDDPDDGDDDRRRHHHQSSYIFANDNL